MNVQIRKPHSLPRFLLPVILLASCLPSFGQWRTEIFDLNPGWQAIYLRVDPGIDRSIATTLFAGGHTNVTEVWRWNPSGLDPTIFNDPQTPIVRPEWQVWERDNPSSLLSVWFPNSGYLVHVAEDAEPFQLEIKGTVTTPEIRWRTDGLNLLGFPTNPDDPPTVEEYFAPGLVNDQTEIFGYIGGPLISGTNPEQLVPDVAPLRRGAAYWVRTEKYADYDGPLRVRAALGEGLDFGGGRSVVRVVLTNRDDDPMTAILTPVDSEAAPGASDVPTAVPLTFGVDADGATRFQPFGTQRTVSLQPGETLGVSIGMSRTALTGNPGDLLHSLLKVTDEGGLTEFYLPVRSEIIGVGGLWVGKAEITHVQNQLQTFEKDEDGNYLVDSNGQHIASMTNGNALVDTELNRTAQTLTLNLILHADEAGTSRLLSQVYYGVVAETTNGIPVDGLSRSQDALMAKHLDAAARVSAVHFPMGMDLALSGSVGAGATVNGTLSLGHDDAGNPFIHTYHPDHDNLDARFENPLPSGVESHRIDRAIALTFDSDPGEITDPAWGSTLFSGTYTETITGIHKNPIAISGVFAIRRVSEITNLQSN